MISKNFQVGAVGASIEVFIKEDGLVKNISTAVSKKIRLTGPDGVSKDYIASFLTDGTDGALYYTTLGDELYAPGYWQAQAVLDLVTFQGSTAKFFFNVNDNLPTPV